MMMKVINSYRGRGDFNGDRLFFHLQNAGLDMIHFQKIKSEVYFLETQCGPKILKGFTHEEKLKDQMQLLKLIFASGFTQMSFFEKFPNGMNYFYYRNYIWTLQQFIVPTKEFHFKIREDRRDAYDLLAMLHRKSSNINYSCASINYHPFFINRFLTFEKFVPLIQYYLDEKTIHQLINWGAYSLNFIKDIHLPNAKKTMIHGDVAHHNFIRGKGNNLYLIDFDLVKWTYPEYEALQYFNRILPYLEWDIKKSMEEFPENPYLEDENFLKCLIFPSDLYREWNNICKFQNYAHLNYLIQYTENEVSKRAQFVQKIMSMVK